MGPLILLTRSGHNCPMTRPKYRCPILLSLLLVVSFTGCPVRDKALPAEIRYRYEDAAFLIGYLAGRLTLSSAKRANPEAVVGVLYHSREMRGVTHYLPAFRAGVYRADPSVRVECRDMAGSSAVTAAATELYGLGADTLCFLPGVAYREAAAVFSGLGGYVLLVEPSSLSRPEDLPGVTARFGRRTLFSDREIAEFETGGSAGIAEGVLFFQGRDRIWRKEVPRYLRRDFWNLYRKMQKGQIRVVKPEMD